MAVGGGSQAKGGQAGEKIRIEALKRKCKVDFRFFFVSIARHKRKPLKCTSSMLRQV